MQRTPSPSVSTSVILAPVMTSRWSRLRKARWTSLEESASSSGRSRSSSSTMVTSTPNADQAVANSMPTAPEPSTIAEPGSSSRCRAWSELSTFSPSKAREGQLRRLGTRGQHDVGRRHGALAVVGLHGHGVSGGQRAGALDGLDPTTLERALQALPHLVDHAVLVLVQRGDLDALVGRLHAEVARVLGVLGDLGRLQDGLGGDAAPVQAGPADLGLLDQGDLEPELGGAQRDRVAAGAGAQHDRRRGCGPRPAGACPRASRMRRRPARPGTPAGGLLRVGGVALAPVGGLLVALLVLLVDDGASWSPPPSSASSPSDSAPSASPMTAMTWPTSTVSSTSARSSCTVPATGEGISVSTLSVEISTRGWSTSTVSPTSTSQDVITPSSMDSPSWGSWTSSATGGAPDRCAHDPVGVRAGSVLRRLSGRTRFGAATPTCRSGGRRRGVDGPIAGPRRSPRT